MYVTMCIYDHDRVDGQVAHTHTPTHWEGTSVPFLHVDPLRVMKNYPDIYIYTYFYIHT